MLHLFDMSSARQDHCRWLAQYSVSTGHHGIVTDRARCDLGQTDLKVTHPKNGGINLAHPRSGALEATLVSREIGDDF
jgi:hypothetical protein